MENVQDSEIDGQDVGPEKLADSVKPRRTRRAVADKAASAEPQSVDAPVETDSPPPVAPVELTDGGSQTKPVSGAGVSRSVAASSDADAVSIDDPSSKRQAAPGMRAMPSMASLKARLPHHMAIYATALCTILGVGAVLGSQIKQAREPAVAAAEIAVVESAKKEVAESQSRDSKLRDDVRALRAELAALRTNNEQLRQADMQKLGGDLRSVRATLEAHKADAASLKADVAARTDRADKVAERVDRLEKRVADATPTGTTPTKAPAPDHPSVEKAAVKGIVLRDAQRGVALVETRRGLIEVMPGDTIPGAGRVETIERHAGRWRIVTTTGIIDDRIE